MSELKNILRYDNEALMSTWQNDSFLKRQKKQGIFAYYCLNYLGKEKGNTEALITHQKNPWSVQSWINRQPLLAIARTFATH